MDYLSNYQTNVGKPAYREGEKWIVRYDKLQVMDTNNMKVPIFGKKTFLQLILTNQRVLITNADLNLYKMIELGEILLDHCEMIKGGMFSKKAKLFVKLKTRVLYFVFTKKECTEFLDKLKMVMGGETEPEKASPSKKQKSKSGKSSKSSKKGDVKVEEEEPVVQKQFVFDLSPYSEIFEKDESVAKHEAYYASPEQIAGDLDILLGPAVATKAKGGGWSSESAEVADFRTNMKKIGILNRAKLARTQVPPAELALFLSTEPEPKDASKVFFVCGVHVGVCQQFQEPIFQSCHCNVKTDADSFLTQIIRKVNNIRKPGTPEILKEDWVLKVTGANEYIYGTHELFKFEAIRRALKYGKPYIELNMMKKSDELAKVDHEKGRLRHLEYFPHKVRENIVIDHDEFSLATHAETDYVNMDKLSIRDIDRPFRMTIRDFTCANGRDAVEIKISKKEYLDTTDLSVFVHAKLVYGYYVLAEGYTKTTNWCNRSVFDEELFLFSKPPDKLKKAFSVNDFHHRGGVKTCVRVKKEEISKLDKRKTMAESSGASSKTFLGLGAALAAEKHAEGRQLQMKDMPRETALLVTVYCRKFDPKDPMLCASDILEFSEESPEGMEVFKHGVGEIREGDRPLGSFSIPMFTFDGKLETGKRFFPLSVGTAANLWSFGMNESEMSMNVELPEFALPVVYPTSKYEPSNEEIQAVKEWEVAKSFRYGNMASKKITPSMIENITSLTPMAELSGSQRYMIWKLREQIIEYPGMMIPFLRSIPCQFPSAIVESKRLLETWKPLEDPLDALELLDFKYADTKVRTHAVNMLMNLPDHEVRHYVLQLVQALKFELYHDSALTRFLLKRALQDEDIGQNFFWYLKSEMHIPNIRERFGLINEEFLKHCGGFRVELLKQNCVVEQLLKMSKEIVASSKAGMKKNDLHGEIRRMLSQAKFPKRFKLPLSSKVEICEPVVEKCRVMGSAKKPLFLFFKNSDEFSKDLYGIMFKVGDDLRQDLLTLQMLRIMDILWKQNGLDFHIRPYGCITTGDMEGMIEIVQRSDTIANIMCHFGNDLKKQLLPDRFLKWLELWNPKSEHHDMKDNFKKSSAGYCIASLVLGLGDRHSDNIMMSKNGDLFHIDFGHFLGHKKKFMGWDRETTPFVFTYQYAYVLENVRSKMFKEFEELCVKAFTMIRKKAKLLMVLLMLMLGCGIPELQTEKEIEWIPTIMEYSMKLSPEQIERKVKDLIMESVKNKRQIMSDTIHNLKHKGMKGAFNVTSIISGLNFDRHINAVL